MTEKIPVIKNIVEEILGRLDIRAAVEVVEEAGGPKFIIKTPEGGLLIGENGKNLISLNHIVKKLCGKKFGKAKESLSFSLDVNDYQAGRIEELKNLARLNAQRVRYFKKEVSLKAMSSFERRIIHSALADYPDIVTFSQDKEPKRHVVIKPLAEF